MQCVSSSLRCHAVSNKLTWQQVDVLEHSVQSCCRIFQTGIMPFCHLDRKSLCKTLLFSTSGWPQFTEHSEHAVMDVERALNSVQHGRSPKEARFVVYSGWAKRAGCIWDPKRMFALSDTRAHSLVK